MKKRRGINRSFKDSNDLVTEIVGTVLLLGIAVAVFSTLYVVVLSSPSPSSTASVNLVGTIEGSNIVIEHRGGEELSLDTEILIEIAGEKMLFDGRTPTVQDLLDVVSKEDGVWNVGERLFYPFEYNINHHQAEVMAIDRQGDSFVLIGALNIQPECDIGLEQTIDEQFPEVGDIVNIVIGATNYRGDIDVASVSISSKLPDGLTYQGHFNTGGSYNPDTGIWDIDDLAIGESVTINIAAAVTSIGIPEFTQLAILLDGSESISITDWNIMRQGLAAGIKNTTCFPHGGSVELTVIQFGGLDPAIAQVEIGPIVVNDTNYMSIARDIMDIDKLGNATPMACAINLAADTLAASPNFNISNRQVINLVTDGVPNCVCEVGEYTGKWIDSPTGIARGKASAEAAMSYLLSTLGMTADQDEFDAEAVGTGPDVAWLRDYIVWPGSYEWSEGSPPGPGWVRHVSDYKEFSDIIDELLEIFFSWDITNTADIVSSTPRDLNPTNNKACIRITPRIP